MFKKISFLFLCLLSACAQQNMCRDEFKEFQKAFYTPWAAWKGLFGCSIPDKNIEIQLKVSNKSFDFLPRFSKDTKHKHLYWLYASSNGTYHGFLNDCCDKNFTRNESCKLPPFLSGDAFYLLLRETNQTYCIITLKAYLKCPFSLTRKLKVFKEPCKFLPQFSEGAKHDHLYSVYDSSNHRSPSFVNDCYQKNVTRNERCVIPPLSPGVDYTLVVKISEERHCIIPLTYGEPEDKMVNINIARHRKYCYFQVDSEHIPMNASRDSKGLVIAVPEWKYREPSSELSCTENVSLVERNASVILKNLEEVSCKDVQRSGSTLEFLAKEMEKANGISHCVYVYLMKQFDCLLPEPVQKVPKVTNILFFLLPLTSLVVLLVALVIWCFRHTLSKALRYLLCLEDRSDKKAKKIWKIDFGTAEELVPYDPKENPDEIFSGTVLLVSETEPVTNFPSNNVERRDTMFEESEDPVKIRRDTTDSGITSDGSRGSEGTATALLVNKTEPATNSPEEIGDDDLMAINKKSRIVGQSDTHEETKVNCDEVIVHEGCYFDGEKLNGELDSELADYRVFEESEDPVKKPKDFVQPRFSCTSTTDSGIASNGSRGSAGVYCSKNEDLNFFDYKNAILTENTSDYCTEEDANFVEHIPNTATVMLVSKTEPATSFPEEMERTVLLSASSADTGCVMFSSTDDEDDYCSKTLNDIDSKVCVKA